MADEKKRDPYDLRAIFDQLTLSLITNLRRNLRRHRDEEVTEGFRWEMWQKAKLRALEGYRHVNRRLIRGALREAEQLTGEVIQQSYETGMKRAEDQAVRVVKRAAEGKIDFPEDIRLRLPQPSAPPAIDPPQPTSPVPRLPPSPEPLTPSYDDLPHAGDEKDFFGLNEKKLQALKDSAKQDIRKSGGNVLRKMDDVYRQTIYGAEVHMAAGAKTLDQAVDMATKEFLSRGIDTITYSNGRRVEIGAYAEMALRTASQRATFMGEGRKRVEWGIYTVVMSSHDNCSPWCMPYQGTVMIDDVYTSISKDDAAKLSKETGYMLLSHAMNEGAFHPNCRHTLATFFPGISRLPVKADEKNAARNYAAEQRQRYIERQIRRYKRLEAGGLDPNNQAGYGKKVREWQTAMKEHMAANPQLRRDRWRERAKLPPLTTKETMKNNAVADQKQYDRYKLMYGDELGATTLDEFQRIKYTDSERWEQLKANRQAALNKRNYHEGMFGQFGNQEVRGWYVTQDRNIGKMLDSRLSMKDQAIQALELRNRYRTEARHMMRDRVEAERLERDHPNPSMESLIKHKMNKYGLSEEEAYTDIVRSSQTPNEDVNRKFNIE